MPRLIALEASGDESFVDELRRTWDQGDAVLPVDPRLPRAAAKRLVAAMSPDEPVEPGDALVVATSGTSGDAKGVVLTHDAVRASALATSARLGVDPASDVWLACLPLSHVGGLSVVCRALVTGTQLLVKPRFDAEEAQAAARAGATMTALVATALRRLSAPEAFRRIVIGGAASPPHLPANVVVTYGMTETGSGVVYDGIPLDGVEVRVADDGAISVRGPMLLRAYRDGTDPKGPDGWFATGDLGAWDSDRLVVHGRTEELIITGGENVWPVAVERILADVPGVADVAVIGRPDEEWGAVVTAVVVPADPASPPALASLRAAVKEHIGPWAAPKALELTAAIPRTALGKIRRGEISRLISPPGG